MVAYILYLYDRKKIATYVDVVALIYFQFLYDRIKWSSHEPSVVSEFISHDRIVSCFIAYITFPSS